MATPTRRPPRAFRLLRIGVRRTLVRIDRWDAKRLEGATPWGASLTLHATFLILIALLILLRTGDDGLKGEPGLTANFADQLIDDLTTLEDADQIGDPFNRLDDEFPSLSDDPTALNLNLPDLPDTIKFAPQLDLKPPELVADHLDLMNPEPATAAVRFSGEARTAPFTGRQAEAKAQLLRSEGGSVESEAAVERGLDWLARHQGPDGHWSLDPLPHCTGDGCPANASMQSDTAATGLALLPLLGAGHSHNEPGRYQKTIQDGLDWLLKVQKKSGELFTGGTGNARMYSHAIAAMALCEAYGLTRDRRLQEPAQRAVDFIVQAQNQQDRGWRYQPGAAGDTSVFGWQVLCLRSAHLAGLKVPPHAIKGCHAYLNYAATDRTGATYGYRPGRSADPVMTSEALLCRQYLGWKRTHPALRKGADLVFADLMESSQRNVYYWYYATQMLHNMGGPIWESWNLKIRDGLVANQFTGQGCDHGSWDPIAPQPDRWGRNAGRHYTTCLSLLTLEVYYRYLPLYRDASSHPLASSDAAERPAED
ncbi:hypothetical protein BH23PLA1_BH23PLA1_00720 [soil metagenome]